MGKLQETSEAVERCLSNGTSVYLAGFTHLLPFATAHEIIRQGYSGLHLIRATPDLLYDRMIAAGCADKMTFSWAGNPGVGTLRAFRRAVERGIPNEIEIDEYSHFALVSRLSAGAQGLPFKPLMSLRGSGYLSVNDNISTVDNPFAQGPDEIAVVPPLNPDVAVVRAQRADSEGNAHLWGITGEIVDAAFAADTVLLSVEEVVDPGTIRRRPDRTLLPGPEIDVIVEEPFGSHPSYAQDYYDRDNKAYREWDRVSRCHDTLMAWLDEWVYGVDDHAGYLDTLGRDRLSDLQSAGGTQPVGAGDDR